MHRRNFLTQCGLAAAGTLCASLVLPSAGLLAASPSAASAGTLNAVDPALTKHLSTYSARVYLWDAGALTQATGLEADAGTINLLVRVDDLTQLVQSFATKRFKKLGKIYVIGNTLSFTFQGQAYTVTNTLPEDFKRVKQAAQ